jgi:hypothetical protein
MSILSSMKGKYFKDIFVHLLKDHNGDVREAIAQKLNVIILHLNSRQEDPRVFV